MNDYLVQVLDDIATDAINLTKRLTQHAGKLPPLVEAQAVVEADQLRNELRRLAEKVTDATAKAS